MSKSVVVSVEWLEGLLKEARKTLVFHNGIMQEPKPHEVALLLGYISSIGYMLPDGDKEFEL